MVGPRHRSARHQAAGPPAYGREALIRQIGLWGDESKRFRMLEPVAFRLPDEQPAAGQQPQPVRADLATKGGADLRGIRPTRTHVPTASIRCGQNESRNTMTEHNPTVSIPDDVPTSVVYDMLIDTATHLSARYVKLSDDAATEDEGRDWWAKVLDLRDEKEAVRSDDRATMIAKITLWTAEIRELDEKRRG